MVLEPLKKYLLSADSISWPLRVLDKVVATKDEVVDVLAEVMKRHEPGYERDPTKKIQLHDAPGGDQAARACRRWWLPYLADMDRACATPPSRRCSRRGTRRRRASRCSIVFVSDKEESLRLRIRIADGFAELGWSLGDRRAEVEKRLPDAFRSRARGKEPAAHQEEAGRRRNKR